MKTRCVYIRFVGVWDTVAAYGLPIDELTKAVSRWVWPMFFADRSLPCKVQYARHAMCLDDERRTFFPIPWTPETGPRPYGETLNTTRQLQVWFPGVHANVGGGYPDDRLAHVSLCWMLEEAQRFGLRFKTALWDHYKAVASDDGRIYDSRAGAWTIYRYHPRSLARLMDRPEPAAFAMAFQHLSKCRRTPAR